MLRAAYFPLLEEKIGPGTVNMHQRVREQGSGRRSIVVNNREIYPFAWCWDAGLISLELHMLFMISNGPIPNGGCSTDGPGSPEGTVPGAGQLQPPPPHSVIVQGTLEEHFPLGSGSVLYYLEEILAVHETCK